MHIASYRFQVLWSSAPVTGTEAAAAIAMAHTFQESLVVKPLTMVDLHNTHPKKEV